MTDKFLTADEVLRLANSSQITLEQVEQAKRVLQDELDSIQYSLEDRETLEYDRLMIVERKRQILRALNRL